MIEISEKRFFGIEIVPLPLENVPGDWDLVYQESHALVTSQLYHLRVRVRTVRPVSLT